MFSIAAINDTDSREQWEPLAPTKEAQEFHVTQTYHEGLLKLQSKEYEKARELLESVLKDPLISNAQVDGNASDCHLLQLRFLALKNLANVFLQQGSAHYEGALHCYLQAVEIDAKDSVVWNQLGTLSCTMGLLSISRWAFEQGLLCSPNNWNCMEKLLEILIAIGDEVACLSVAELILRHWPSHSRALHVKNTIESEAVPLAPRGIDKLEPKHVRLKFPEKRKAADENDNEDVLAKKLCNEIEVMLAEVSWSAVIDALLDILLPLNGFGSEKGTQKVHRSGDVRLKVLLPAFNDIYLASAKKEVLNSDGLLGDYSMERPSDHKEREGNNFEEHSHERRSSNHKEREAINFEEHPHERRSTRLESLRSRKPGKEDFDFAASKDLAKDVLQFVEHFILENLISNDLGSVVSCVVPCPEKVLRCDTEQNDVYSFISETSKNYGAYHLGHLLLEHAAGRMSVLHQDVVVKFLHLERLTRQWAQDRTAECSLFLAELYYDLGSLPCNGSKMSEYIAEASYHLCKIIESVVFNFPLPLTQLSSKENMSPFKSFKDCDATLGEDSSFQESSGNGLFLKNKCTFWARYIWLSGRMSTLNGNKVKAHQEFCVSLALLEKKDTPDNFPCSIHLPHLKTNKELTISKILYEINILKVDFLLEKTLGDLIEEEKYVECIDLLVPLLFSMEDVQPNVLVLPAACKIGDDFTSVELSALNILIKACEKEKPTYAEVLLNCHRHKLQILMILAGMDKYISLHQRFGVKSYSASQVSGKEVQDKHLDDLVAEEVKAISQCVSEMKNFIDPSSQSSFIAIPTTTISEIQLLLSAIMCHIAINHFSKKSSASVTEGTDQTQKCSFVDTCIVFCKLQHLILSVPVQTQVELIVAMHNLLAEYGLCCAGGVEGDEGLFLKFAIKHLLALDMKLKSNLNSSTRDQENKESLSSSQNRTGRDGPKSDITVVEMGGSENVPSIFNENSEAKQIASKEGSSHTDCEMESAGVQDKKQYSEEGKDVEVQSTARLIGQGDELNEDDREELELLIDSALDQCFFCLYGLNLRSDASYEDDLVMHKNTCRSDYQTREQCADVFKYILPYAKASSRTGLIKLRRVLRAIRKHFPQPPDAVLGENAIDRFLDDPDLCEDKLSEEAGSRGFLDSITNVIFPHDGGVKEHRSLMIRSSEPYSEVYCNLYYLLALSEEMNATDKWTGFVLTTEGEEFVRQSANLFKYDLLYNPLRFESWQRLANIYDEEVDLLLNDGSKHINVAGWRKNSSLPQRVETSRRRSKRCLLMSLALAKTSAQQSEIHELLALVYYDSLQNVVPFYDQRSVVPQRDAAWTLCCENSLRHFKKAYLLKQDWSHAFYMGKLCEKLGYSYDTALSYYDKAIALNPSAVDPVYRMHASRLKLLCNLGRQNLEALKVLSGYAYSQSVRDSIMEILGKMSLDKPQYSEEFIAEVVKNDEMEEAWNMLYKDCLSALEICLEGDLKHFHKARYMLAQGLFKRGTSGDLERAKDELSFCFKSARSSFTINMWEIDGLVKKGRRKTPGFTGSKKVLEVNLPESSRKFITCIRKYLLFYLKLLEETGDICTLDRAFVSLRADKRFSLCIEDLVPIALGRLLKALVSSVGKSETASSITPESSKNPLEKLFSVFLEQGNLWTEISSLPEIRGPEMSESSLYGCLHRYIASLETNGKLDTLEAINEKIRKRYKNPKLSNSTCAKVCRHASVAWCRHLIINLAMITPIQLGVPVITQTSNLSDSSLEHSYFLCVDLQANEFWSSFSEGMTYLGNLETKWNPLLAKMKRIIIRKASDENLETANSLLRSSYNFYRESSCATIPSGVGTYLVSSQITIETQIHPGLDGVEILDLSIPRKLLLWAYTLLHGRYANISSVVKHCEETVKSKIRRAGASSVPPATSLSSAPTSNPGGGKEDASQSGETAISVPSSVCQGENSELKNPSVSPFCDNQKDSSASPQQGHCDESMADRGSILHEDVDTKRI